MKLLLFMLIVAFSLFLLTACASEPIIDYYRQVFA